MFYCSLLVFFFFFLNSSWWKGSEGEEGGGASGETREFTTRLAREKAKFLRRLDFADRRERGMDTRNR